MFLSGNAAKIKQKILTTVTSDSASNDVLAEGIDEIAANITVKILDKDFLGSGFIAQQEGDRYTVITNQHVLRAGEGYYRVQTSDGKIHSAKVIESGIKSDYQYDLAILEFTTNTDYAVAKIGSSLYLEVGEPIFAVGFPYSELETEIFASIGDKVTGLAIKTGRVAIILNKALIEGYQIGYTNDVKKGMSGGPLLNNRGEVVGINGKHAYPLWESPELYQDGSQPCPALEELITRSSLAIPIEKSIELNPKLESVRPKSNVETSRQSNLVSEDPESVAQMQTEAATIIQECDRDFIGEYSEVE